jgi:TPR repeat protein
MNRHNQAQHGGVLSILLVAILLAAGVFMWFARIMDVPAPVVPGTVTTEPFLELDSPQVVDTSVTYTLADEDELSAFLTGQEQAALDQSQPLRRVGETVELRQASGVVGRGEILALDDQVLVQQQGSLTNQITLASLDAWDRLRADTRLRAQVVRYRARSLARYELAQLGQRPVLASTNTEAVAAGEPAALHELGMRHITGREVPADPGLGFFLIYQAALDGWPAAQHNLGILYLRGLAVGQNIEEGLRWICLAARNQWRPAQAFLDEKKVAGERSQALAIEREKLVQDMNAAAQARLATTKKETLAATFAVSGRPLRPNGHTFADFKLRYYWWRPEAEPAFEVSFDPQGRRHIHLPRP